MDEGCAGTHGNANNGKGSEQRIEVSWAMNQPTPAVKTANTITRGFISATKSAKRVVKRVVKRSREDNVMRKSGIAYVFMVRAYAGN